MYARVYCVVLVRLQHYWIWNSKYMRKTNVYIVSLLGSLLSHGFPCISRDPAARVFQQRVATELKKNTSQYLPNPVSSPVTPVKPAYVEPALTIPEERKTDQRKESEENDLGNNITDGRAHNTQEKLLSRDESDIIDARHDWGQTRGGACHYVDPMAH